MPFLPPNQQRQSTEGKSLVIQFTVYCYGIYSAPVGESSIAMSMFVYLLVCLHAYLTGITVVRTPPFFVCCLRPWLCPPLAALQYVMHCIFSFTDDVMFSYNGSLQCRALSNTPAARYWLLLVLDDGMRQL